MGILLEDAKATGYDPFEKFFASRYKQGGRTVYALDWSVYELVTFLPKPDPLKPLGIDATQRRITPAHAKGFADYVREDDGWVSPALLLRAPDIFIFEPVKDLETGSTQFGLLSVPKDAKAEIQIVDGQHRTLGFHLAWDALSHRITKVRTDLARSKEVGDPVGIDTFQKELNRVTARRTTLSGERVSVQIVIVHSPEIARRVFVDINDNAKGITGALKTRFNDRTVVSRAVNLVLVQSELLRGRVDIEQDRVSGSSPYLLGAKHLADVLRALVVGHGRIGKRLEDELDEKSVVARFDAFARAMTQAFPPLKEVEEGLITPAELRGQSLIGSNVMLRGFALAWHALKQEDWSDTRIAKAFGEIAPMMTSPVYPVHDDTWFATGLFPTTLSGATSPTSRAQDLKALAAFIVSASKGQVAWRRSPGVHVGETLRLDDAELGLDRF